MLAIFDPLFFSFQNLVIIQELPAVKIICWFSNINLLLSFKSLRFYFRFITKAK
jgi:hypothetical protein